MVKGLFDQWREYLLTIDMGVETDELSGIEGLVLLDGVVDLEIGARSGLNVLDDNAATVRETGIASGGVIVRGDVVLMQCTATTRNGNLNLVDDRHC